MRYAFRVTEGRALVDLDYGGMELRAACSDRIADEPAMREVFNSGGDVHRATAAKMFSISEDEVTDEQRRQAKATNFGALLVFTQWAGQLLPVPRRHHLAQRRHRLLNSWLAAYPNIARWHRHCKSMVEQGLRWRWSMAVAATSMAKKNATPPTATTWSKAVVPRS